MASHYEVLGVPESACDEDVRHAYRRLVKAVHPDRAGDPEQFRLVTEAYDVLSHPARRAAYDRSLRRTPVVPAPSRPARRPRRRGAVVLVVLALVAGTITWLVVAAASRSVGDDCLVGTWRGDDFEVPFRASLDGREITAPIRGGAGVRLRVDADGIVRTDYAEAAPLVGADGSARIEGVYTGTTVETWRARGGTVQQSNTDTSRLVLQATINGRPPDAPLALTVVDRQYPYSCSPSGLEVGPYRYTRLAGA